MRGVRSVAFEVASAVGFGVLTRAGGPQMVVELLVGSLVGSDFRRQFGVQHAVGGMLRRRARPVEDRAKLVKALTQVI